MKYFALLILLVAFIFSFQPLAFASSESRSRVQNEIDPCLGDVPQGCSITISICDTNGWYTCPIRFWGSMTSSGFRASGEWWPDGDSFSNFMDAGLDWAESYDIVGFTYSCGDWPPPGACSEEEPPPEEPPPEEPPPEEPPPECPPGGDCECSDIICRCIEALAAIVEQFKQAVIPLLEQIRDAVSSTQEFVAIDFDYINQQISGSFDSCSASYDHLDLQPRSFSEILGLLSNKMPFDVWGNTSIPSTDGCVNIEISGRSIRVCAFGFAGRVFGQIAGLVLILRAIVRG